MPKIRFIEANGGEHSVEGVVGDSLMKISVDNMVPGILGECGGVCICATCHVIIDAKWSMKLPEASENEREMLAGAIEVSEHSRLSCQIIVDDHLDGLVVHLPAHQL